jgi:CRP-like cAMP-binding protein
LALASFGGKRRRNAMPAHVAKTGGTTARLREALRANFLFRTLPDALVDECVHVLRPFPVGKGTRLARQGEKADFFFVVEEGTFDALLLPPKLMLAARPTTAKSADGGGAQAKGAGMAELWQKGTRVSKTKGTSAQQQPRGFAITAAAIAAGAALAGGATPSRAVKASMGARRPSAAPSLPPTAEFSSLSSRGGIGGEPGLELDLSRATVIESYVPAEGKPLPCFGELALLYAKPRAATVVARTAGLVWGLERYAFRTIRSLAKNAHFVSSVGVRGGPGGAGDGELGGAGGAEAEAAQKIAPVLASIPILEPLSAEQLHSLELALVERSYSAGETLATQGRVLADEEDALVIVLAGSARAIQQGSARGSGPDAPPIAEMLLEKGDYFGADELFSSHPRQASVLAVTDLRVACLSRARLEKAVGSLQVRAQPISHIAIPTIVLACTRALARTRALLVAPGQRL